MQANLQQFAQKISRLGLSEVGCAVALLWFIEREGVTDVTPARLADLMHDLALKGKINLSRFTRQLLENADVIRGKVRGTVKLRLVSKSRLDGKYLPFCGSATPTLTDDHILASDLFSAGPTYLARIVAQINGCYHYGFHDGCAVLCRRLMECLLILAFEKRGHGSVIRDGSGEYKGLGDIIRLAASGQYLKLTRGTDASMTAIKKLGDTGAHHPVYVTRQKDIDAYRLDYAKLISELAHFAA
ncbi:hypothetical protein [Bradyrhizobium cosmicum]|uniref:hypothetical protein n=1 Tax=Bradyrhizobium cosmicum TaxID=1404864 RepID=UPI0011656923|nr:hypothetical protein [Bradyrhizobium cosmicum]QDP23946.1 hypothetical protein FNV92_18095 [Bradyrhizobium cosmicum]